MLACTKLLGVTISSHVFDCIIVSTLAASIQSSTFVPGKIAWFLRKPLLLYMIAIRYTLKSVMYSSTHNQHPQK